MRDKLECGVFYLNSLGSWLDEFIENISLKTDRLQLTKIDVRIFAQGDDFKIGNSSFPHPHVFKDLAILFERYDCLILPVVPESLVWTRIMLAQLGGLPKFPLVVLAHQVQPAAFVDLSKLGVRDYIFEDDHPTLMRVRISNLLERAHYQSPAIPLENGKRLYSALKTKLTSLNDVARTYKGKDPDMPQEEDEQQKIQDNPVQEVKRRRGTSSSSKASPSQKKRMTDSAFINYADGFQTAKSKMIKEFERKYIVNALRQAQGNICMAAQLAQKHRRAFWELMRKHKIHAEDYKV